MSDLFTYSKTRPGAGEYSGDKTASVLSGEYRPKPAPRLSQARSWWVICGFSMGYIWVFLNFINVAFPGPKEPRLNTAAQTILSQRANILDRNQRILATNIATHALYAHPHEVIDPAHAARELARIFPNMDADKLQKRLSSERKFIWLRRRISPEQKQAVHDIGDPGLIFGPREMRLYPNGSLAAHVLGGFGFGKEDVRAAEVLGVAGVEKQFDAFLRDSSEGEKPLILSIDITIQDITERVLKGGMLLTKAKGGAAVLMDIRSGEIIALASLPDFNPNKRPRPRLKGDQSDDPLFNRAVQGRYEFGSVFKLFTIAQALELGLITPQSEINTTGPMRYGGFEIKDYRSFGASLSATNVVVKSSNIGAARIAHRIEGERQKEFLNQLGLLRRTSLEVLEAGSIQPGFPKRWSETSVMTISYGHGVSISLVHLAAAYASILNGGKIVRPTIVKTASRNDFGRIISPEVSQKCLEILRKVVTEGTASLAQQGGYTIAGKTGTADKPNAKGGYFEDRNIATFASVFPTNAPRYVLVVMLDEPKDKTGKKTRRTAGWTAVPVASEIIQRIAPLLGLKPDNLQKQRPRLAVRAAS